MNLLDHLKNRVFTILSVQFGWFRNVKDALVLLDAIHTAYSRPEYLPKDGVTHCNQFVVDVCSVMGFRGLDGLLANEIIDALVNNPQWSEIELERCQELANGGTLIIAGVKEQFHGHVNVICPGKEKVSGRWGVVPTVANVGKTNFIGKGVNWAFSVKPKFWVWRQTL